MTIVRGGQSGSGLDRALENALRSGLDDILMSGELYEGERRDFPEPYGPYSESARPWQMGFDQDRLPPAADESLIHELLVWIGGTGAAPDAGAQTATPRPTAPPPMASASEREEAAQAKLGNLRVGDDGDTEANRARSSFRFRDDLTGVIMIHGVGQQPAGETLLDWTRPIATLLGDAAIADAALAPSDRRLKPLAQAPRPVSDPVYKSNIDFSGQTFPVVQLRIPGRTDVPDADPRASERRWLVTETWWAAEVRPPTLQAMVGWLGEGGGLARIVQGLQDHMLGRGFFGNVARVSLQALISVIAAFTLLFFAVLLGITKLVPFGPLKDFVSLQLAASWLTDGFGGARTLLLDPAQSANVRSRLVATIKALRAYGCRNVVIVAHSGGTMVSLQTLTDPAYQQLQVEKLITIGEALNLGWRLENTDQDVMRPRLPYGDRMLGDLATQQPRLLWRDFWATHDPAASGPPVLPEGMTDAHPPRFLAERVYNRMRINEDHGTYWDNDEHFLIPLIREIDSVTTDRSNSAFYSDAAESAVRARRKERISLLALWRRATLALPLMAVLAALLVTAGGRLNEAGQLGLQVWGLVPGHDLLASAGRWLNDQSDTKIAAGLPGQFTWRGWYDLGLLLLQIVFLFALVHVLVPGRLDRLWRGRRVARVVMVLVELALGVGTLAVVVLARAAVAPPGSQVSTVVDLVPGAGRPVLVGIALVAILFLIGLLGRRMRATIDGLQGKSGYRDRFVRDGLIVVSALFLASVFLFVLVGLVGVLLVFAGNGAASDSDGTRLLLLGAIVVLGGFQVIQRLGTWRWDSWDERERRALRRRPTSYPFRNWAYILTLMLSVVAILAALVVALTGPNWTPPLLTGDGWVIAFCGLVLLVVVISVGKDVVDNDIDTAAEAVAIVPNVTGPAAGSSAG
jgi:hypothetical protein